MTASTDGPVEKSLLTSALRVGTVLAVVFVCVFVALLSLRTIRSVDLGYHLAYGDHFLQTGEIVDHDPTIYTLPDASTPPQKRPEPGPSCWYDSAGRYRFPNANWLSQIVMAGAWRLGGITGLCLLSAALVCAAMAVSLLVMRRLEVPWALAAGGLLIAALASSTRLLLRPELLGYVVLMGQFALLAGAFRPADAPRPIGRGAMVAVIVLQALLVNLHSYFLLGLALSGALWVRHTLGWLRAMRRKEPDRRRWAATVRGTSALLIGQIAACFVNPWTWRLAILPIETILYLHSRGISGGVQGHPWAAIAELKSVFVMVNDHISLQQGAMMVLGVLGILAVAAGLIKRRFDLVILVGGMLFIGISVRRNHTVAALVLTPAALAAVVAPMGWLGRRLRERARRAAGVGWCTAVIALAAVLSVRVVTNEYYYADYADDRFGVGVSRLALPVGAAEFVNDHLPNERLWCDFASSSYLYHFSGPRRAVPVLSNGWAYPPKLFGDVILLSWGQRDPDDPRSLSQRIEARGAEVVVLDLVESTALFRHLLATSQWTLVHAEGIHVVLIHNTGRLAQLARELDWDPTTMPPGEFIRLVEASDPVPTSMLLPCAEILRTCNWPDLAIVVSKAAVAHCPDDAKTWMSLGLSWEARGALRGWRGLPDFLADWRAAAGYYRKALAIEPDYAAAKDRLNRLTQIKIPEAIARSSAP